MGSALRQGRRSGGYHYLSPMSWESGPRRTLPTALGPGALAYWTGPNSSRLNDATANANETTASPVSTAPATRSPAPNV
jgi:hypothetical protein